MSELPDNDKPKIYGIFESIRRGTPSMTEHLKRHAPGDIELHAHKIGNGIASVAMLASSSFGLIHTVPHVVDTVVGAWQDPEFSASRAFEFGGYTSLTILETGGLIGGLLLGANAQAAYRKQEEGTLGENNSDKTAG